MEGIFIITSMIIKKIIYTEYNVLLLHSFQSWKFIQYNTLQFILSEIVYDNFQFSVLTIMLKLKIHKIWTKTIKM